MNTITLTAIIDAGSLNYDEGLSVISPLKKLNTGRGVRVYMSPQAFKYSLYTTCQELFNWRLSEVKLAGQGDKKTTQRVSSFIESEEVDLFGTMVTFAGGQGYKREAVIRVTPSISTCNYLGDKELLTNMGLSYRIGENPNMATIENDRNLYKYSITIDYDRVGRGEYKVYLEEKEAKQLKNDGIIKEKEAILIDLYKVMQTKGFISLSEKEFLDIADTRVQEIKREVQKDNKAKAYVYAYEITLTEEEIKKRTNELLDGIYYLYRDIRSRREILSPVFCVGIKTDKRLPLFANVVEVIYKEDKPTINTKQIEKFAEKEGLEIDKDYKMGGYSDHFINNFQYMPKDVIEFLKV